TIIGAAMAEGFGIFGITVYALTDNAPVLIAPGVALLALALQFPTRAKLAKLVSSVSGQAWY
ncbi:MAG: hypothetical protein GY842_19225, partial [bacterium]|nr:hypothetical protein [bacterium]